MFVGEPECVEMWVRKNLFCCPNGRLPNDGRVFLEVMEWRDCCFSLSRLNEKIVCVVIFQTLSRTTLSMFMFIHTSAHKCLFIVDMTFISITLIFILLVSFFHSFKSNVYGRLTKSFINLKRIFWCHHHTIIQLKLLIVCCVMMSDVYVGRCCIIM